jgi:hypothetical protein
VRALELALVLLVFVVGVFRDIRVVALHRLRDVVLLGVGTLIEFYPGVLGNLGSVRLLVQVCRGQGVTTQ